jgi:predicted dehydrogenase
VQRRHFLQDLGAMAFAAVLPSNVNTHQGPIFEALQAIPLQAGLPPDSVNFAVCGISHDHIFGMTEAMRRGGGKLSMVWGSEPDKVAAFKRRYPDVLIAETQDQILQDAAVKLVLSSQIASERAPLGVRVMNAGKDFLSDKPGITSLKQLEEVRSAVERTGRIFGIMYSERLEVKAAVHAGELIKAGAIGKVIQTINIAPHQVVQRSGGAAGSSGANGGRPDWFWDDKEYGGILCDIGSHQLDQFLYYTGSTTAEVVASQIANVRHPKHPHFQDFGDMVVRGNNGFGYVRLDWFTPDGLGTWGDGRLFILGTDGYMEARKYVDVAVSPLGNHLFVVDGNQSRMIDCNNVVLPFGPQFISDVVNRTHTAQDQRQCLLAAELSIKAQQHATHVHLDWETKS